MCSNTLTLPERPLAAWPSRENQGPQPVKYWARLFSRRISESVSSVLGARQQYWCLTGLGIVVLEVLLGFGSGNADL